MDEFDTCEGSLDLELGLLGVEVKQITRLPSDVLTRRDHESECSARRVVAELSGLWVD